MTTNWGRIGWSTVALSAVASMATVLSTERGSTPVAAAGSGVVSLVPARLLETRTGPGETTIDGQAQGIGRRPATSVYELKVTDRGGVPTTADAVMLNVTAVFPAAAGFLTVFPCGAKQPQASNINYAPGDVVPNLVLAKIGTAGKVCIYTLANTDIIADVTGYIGTDSPPPPAADYVLVSADTNGNRKSANWDSIFDLVRYSVSDTSVAFAMASGDPNALGYTPIAADEECREATFCADLYLRDLTTETTRSVTAQLDVVNPPRFSAPSTFRNWAVSADHRVFVFAWACGAVSSNTFLAGTQICHVADAMHVLVALDMVSGAEWVVATGASGRIHVSEVSSDGDVIVFGNDSSDEPATYEPCWLPGTCTGSPIWISTGPGTERILGYTQSREDAASRDWQLITQSLSGNGSRLAAIATSLDDASFEDEWWLTVYDRSDSSFRKIALPTGGGRNWFILGFDHAGERVVVARQLRAPSPGTPGGDVYAGDEVLSVAVPGMQVRRLDAARCSASRPVSISANGRYLACTRNNRGFNQGFDESPAVLDLETGAVQPIMTPSAGFDVGRYRSLTLSEDGRTAAVLSHRSPHDDEFNGIDEILARQIYAVTLD